MDKSVTFHNAIRYVEFPFGTHARKHNIIAIIDPPLAVLSRWLNLRLVNARFSFGFSNTLKNVKSGNSAMIPFEFVTVFRLVAQCLMR